MLTLREEHKTKPLTPRLDRILQFALEHSAKRLDEYIGVHHLLLGLCQEQEGLHAEVFKTLGVTLHQITDEVAKRI